MKTIKMMVFDLDGTLISSIDDLTASVNHALTALGFSPLGKDKVRTFVGDGTLMTMRRALKAVGHNEDELALKAYKLFEEHHTVHCLDQTRLYPGVEEIFQHFQKKVLVVSTNKPHGFARQILEGLGVARYLADIMGDGNSLRLKPDPWALIYLMEKHGIEPAYTVMVGDGGNDIQCARKAGTLCCAVGHGNTEPSVLLKMKPDFFCRSLPELKNIFE